MAYAGKNGEPMSLTQLAGEIGVSADYLGRVLRGRLKAPHVIEKVDAFIGKHLPGEVVAA
jgi:hypothetical protein